MCPPKPPFINVCLNSIYIANQNFFSNRGGLPTPCSCTDRKKKKKRYDHIPWSGETFGKSKPGKTQRSPEGFTEIESGSGPRPEQLCFLGWTWIMEWAQNNE